MGICDYHPKRLSASLFQTFLTENPKLKVFIYYSKEMTQYSEKTFYIPASNLCLDNRIE